MYPEPVSNKHLLTHAALVAIFLVLFTSCSPAPAPSPSQLPPPTRAAVPTNPPETVTAFPPSPTPTPVAALVNGEGISLASYQAELTRYENAVGTHLATEDKQRVLDALIDQLLLDQAAREAGYATDSLELQSRYQNLVAQSGGPEAFSAWLEKNAYTEEAFLQDLARATAAAYMRDRITDEAILKVMQVHARQILLYNSDAANQALDRLQAGEDFAALAIEYAPETGGDLGWFPQGYLLDAQLDEAAFTIEPGQYSKVIKTAAGYHILQVIERSTDQPLTPEAQKVVQRNALQTWLNQRRRLSDIQIMLP